MTTFYQIFLKSLFKFKWDLPKITLTLWYLVILANVLLGLAMGILPKKRFYSCVFVQKIHDWLDDSGIIACFTTAPIFGPVVDAMADTLGVAITELRFSYAMLDVGSCAHVHFPFKCFHDFTSKIKSPICGKKYKVMQKAKNAKMA